MVYIRTCFRHAKTAIFKNIIKDSRKPFNDIIEGLNSKIQSSNNIDEKDEYYTEIDTINRDSNKKVEEIILSGAGNKYKEILLITGKGIHSTTDKDIFVSNELSKLKFSVPEFIKNNSKLSEYVISISEASLKDGGSGAILIKLKNL